MTAIRVTTCAALVLLGAVTTERSAIAQTPGRDAAKAVQTGTAVIDGTVVSDDADARPLRRVRVAVVTSDRQVARTVVTDDGGRFSFVALPAGRYMLSANKQGYVPVSYGARRPNRPGTALVLADAQRIAGMTLRMTRGSVISGIIVDQNGDPFSGANVSVMRNAFAGNGQRTLVAVNTVQSDDRGQYRAWGLPTGEYVVSANPGFISPTRDTEIARLTDADIKRALSDVAAGSGRPGGASNPPTEPGPRARSVGYATVFYPGTSVASQAMTVKLGLAEERTGVDFPLSLTPTAKVEGSIVAPEGISPQTVIVQMIGSNPQGALLDAFRRATPNAEGTFTFAGVAPGPYAIVAQAQPPAGRATPATGPPRPTHWARADVTLDGQDISGLALTLQPGLVVAGTLQLLGTSAAPPDLTRVRVNLTPIQGPGEVSLGQMQIQPDASGSFSITGVTPGRYRLIANIASARPETVVWQLKSSVINGRDTLDVPIDLREGTDSAVITFTDQVTELSGMVQDAAGQPAPEYHLVLFARDKTFWNTQSRRIRTIRPGADGKYVMPAVPPGEYLMTAVTDLEPGEQFDPVFLEHLSRSAIGVTISDGEKKTQDLRLAAQQLP